MSQIPFLTKKKLEKDMKLLDNNEYNEVLNILKKNQQKYSSNSKGIFFNLKYVDDSAIKDIIKFVEFCKKNKIYLEEKIDNNTPQDQNLNIKDNFNNDKLDITIDIENIIKKQSKNNNNFTFQNYIDKISIVPKKEFKNKQMSKYPNIVNINNEFTGSSNRILKKCKNFESSYTQQRSNETDNANLKKNILEPELNLR